MELAVGAPEARAAPPGQGGQDPLLDLVHRLVGHTVPGGGGSSVTGEPVWAGGGPTVPTHMTLSLWQSGAPRGHGCCEWTRNLSVLQAATWVTSLDVW